MGGERLEGALVYVAAGGLILSLKTRTGGLLNGMPGHQRLWDLLKEIMVKTVHWLLTSGLRGRLTNASTETAPVSSVCQPSISVRWVEKYFYLCMSLLIAAVVVYGSSYTVENKLIDANPRRPILLWVHVILFSSWVAFYITQSVLVRIRKVELHRTLGWAGAALGTSMVVVGPWVAVVMARFDISQLHRANRDAFLIVPLSAMAEFAICFGLAILWRKVPERHRRLMLIAT
jgi:hypothetical protein